jgi:hypothetical protein
MTRPRSPPRSQLAARNLKERGASRLTKEVIKTTRKEKLTTNSAMTKILNGPSPLAVSNHLSCNRMATSSSTDSKADPTCMINITKIRLHCKRLTQHCAAQKSWLVSRISRITLVKRIPIFFTRPGMKCGLYTHLRTKTE